MFTSLREMRNKGSDLSSLVKQVEDTTKKSYEKEEEGTFWSPPVDKAGNGIAIIRFMPAPKGEDAEFVRRWDHGFQGPTGKWYIENSLTTLGPDFKDPVSEDNSRLWALDTTDDGPNRKIARERKRRLNHYSNILVIKDPARPENEGKVFLFKYGVKIFDKIKSALKPPVEGMATFNPFNLFTGANFQLVVCNVAKRRNYDQSMFLAPGEILGPDGKPYSDDKLDELWNQCRSLKDFLDARHFKSYEVLKKRFEFVTNAAPAAVSAGVKEEKQPELKSEEPKNMKTSTPVEVDEDPEDTEEYFKSLANQD